MATSDFFAIVLFHGVQLCCAPCNGLLACLRSPRANSRRLLRTMGCPSCGAVVRLPQPGRWGRSNAPASASYSSPSDGAAFTAFRRALALVWR